MPCLVRAIRKREVEGYVVRSADGTERRVCGERVPANVHLYVGNAYGHMGQRLLLVERGDRRNRLHTVTGRAPIVLVTSSTRAAPPAFLQKRAAAPRLATLAEAAAQAESPERAAQVSGYHLSVATALVGMAWPREYSFAPPRADSAAAFVCSIVGNAVDCYSAAAVYSSRAAAHGHADMLVDLCCGGGGFAAGFAACAPSGRLSYLFGIDRDAAALGCFEVNMPQWARFAHTTASTVPSTWVGVERLAGRTLRGGAVHVHISPPCQPYVTAGAHARYDLR